MSGAAWWEVLIFALVGVPFAALLQYAMLCWLLDYCPPFAWAAKGLGLRMPAEDVKEAEMIDGLEDGAGAKPPPSKVRVAITMSALERSALDAKIGTIFTRAERAAVLADALMRGLDDAVTAARRGKLNKRIDALLAEGVLVRGSDGIVRIADNA